MPSISELTANRRAFLGISLAGSALGSACGNAHNSEPMPLDARQPLPTVAQKPPEVLKSTPTTETLKTGMLWTQDLVIPLPDFQITRDAFYITPEIIALTSSQGHAMGVRIADGKGWKYDEDPLFVYGADSNKVYGFRQDRRLIGVDTKVGQKKWSVVLSGGNQANIRLPFVVCKDTVHATLQPSQQQFLALGISKDTGSVLWQQAGQIIGGTSFTVIIDGTSGIEPSTGKRKWQVSAPDQFATGRNRRIAGNTLFYKGSNDSPVAALDIDSGTPLWINRVKNDGIVLATPNAVCLSFPTGIAKRGLILIEAKSGNTINQSNEFPFEDFVDEKNEWFVWTNSSTGTTSFTNTVNGYTATNDDLRLNMLSGTVKNIFVGAFMDPRGQSYLYGIDLTAKNADRKWKLPIGHSGYPPTIVNGKVLVPSSTGLQMVDGASGKVLNQVALRGTVSRIASLNNVALIQTGNPGQSGTLSAIRL